MTYQIHPAATLMPALSDDEYHQLCDDIGRHGVRRPIAIWRGLLLDGRHRVRACKELGITAPEVHLADELDPFAYVLSVHIQRALTTSQRAIIAADSVRMQRAEGGEHLPTVAQSAEAARVSPRTMATAHDVLEKCEPEIVEDVRSGKTTLNAAQSGSKPSPPIKPKPQKSDDAEMLETALSRIEELTAEVALLREIVEADDSLAAAVRRIQELERFSR